MLRNNQVDCCIVAGIIEALISVNSPAYHPSNWARTLLTILVVTVVAAFNTVAASHLSFLEGVFATCHVFALVPVCVTLWVLVTPKPSVGEALGHIVDYTGSWATAGLSALVGQKVAILSTIRYSAIGQMAEEVKGASEVVPYGMVWSFVLNIPLTVTMLVTYTFNIGSVDAAIQSPYAFVYVFHNATQSAQATTAFTLIIMLLMLIITASTMAVTTRQAFAFAYVGPSIHKTKLTRLQPPRRSSILAMAYAHITSLRRASQRYLAHRSNHKRPHLSQHS